MNRNEPFPEELMRKAAEGLRRWAGGDPHPWYWHFAAKRVLLEALECGYDLVKIHGEVIE